MGYRVSGDEFKVDCTKFDKLVMVFKDGHYKVVELPEKCSWAGSFLLRGAERERIFTLVYTNREATYIKRFTFGGTILNKEYFCIPEKSRILFFEPDTPEQIYIRYKAAPYQKINQQTCNPSELIVKGVKSRVATRCPSGSCGGEQQAAAQLGAGRADEAVCNSVRSHVDVGNVRCCGRGRELTRRFLARPRVGFEDFLERGMLAHRVHRARDRLGDLREIDFAGAESIDGDFVRCIEHGGQGAAHLPCPARERRWKAVCIRFFKSQAAESGEVCLYTFTARVGVCECILNGQAHVGRGKPAR